MKTKVKEDSLREFQINGQIYSYYSIESLKDKGSDIEHLPFSIRVLLESALRQCDDHSITEKHIEILADWASGKHEGDEVPFKPARVILQDFTGVPAVVDLAAMRHAMKEIGGLDCVEKINPEVPVDLIIDHSVQVDTYGTDDALKTNMDMEFKRNKERYEFLKWAQETFDNFTVVPPGTGIVHQVNLEYLAQVVRQKVEGDKTYLFPDSLVGTDSHTTMINGLGVLGWGVGGIEAEAGMLGQPSYFPVPSIVGVELVGELPKGTTSTDLALKITNILRKEGVVGKFVEYFGKGIEGLSLADRATIANMAPEYGATCGFFPVDEVTLDYLRLTGRSEEQVLLVRTYLEKNLMFYTKDSKKPKYSKILTVDLSTIVPSLSGPKRPQDLITLTDMKEEFRKSVTAPMGNQGHGLTAEEFTKEAYVTLSDGRKSTLKTGSIAIAAITSCTNTSNPYVMLGAGLLAKKALEKGLSVPAHVKTSLAPGSKVVTKYLVDAGLQTYLDQLGFETVGYGCATCIGNSGPLLREIEEAITQKDLLVTSVLSGNRNFEGRIHPLVKANYLASPILVVAYALAGTVDIDFDKDYLSKNQKGEKVYLKDIWPSAEEINEMIGKVLKPQIFTREYDQVYKGNSMWNDIEAKKGALYDFDERSTYIQNPPFFERLAKEVGTIKELRQLRVLGKFGDSITTDHISPAGAIGKNTPAGKYLISQGVDPTHFNTYGSRRGNHEVMMRGTFANIRIRNQIATGTEGGYTCYWPTGEIMSIYDASQKYQKDGTGLVILAGKDYGMGSSRDWAAKGSYLLGVKAVIAESFERIHRSNLVMMGILPLEFLDGDSADSLGLTGSETFEIKIDESIKPHEKVQVKAVSEDKSEKIFMARVRFDSDVDIDYYRHGGILSMVLREKLFN
ncbi:MAG TPA: aconitate hydratase AcnA [Lachnospiraceae bacterium]|uniref:aconitate hydratase AcnA n=1 Tax=Anaerosporobacter sp. TaxID=1872529 RepID=UPI000EE9B71F|nr:aconitate hydratase AcnA [Anaerosporobacter sp.]HAB59533.1 aconitate hydratase AcnA [Lachnospiraceae bacterium]